MAQQSHQRPADCEPGRHQVEETFPDTSRRLRSHQPTKSVRFKSSSSGWSAGNPRGGT